MNLSIPRLETERLVLRGHRLEDFEASYAMWREEAVVRHITKKSATEAEAWSRLHRYVGHWALLGFGYWAVEEKSSGQFVGEMGFADFRRAIEPSITGIPELGWALTTASHGRGYAREALRAITTWGDSTLKSLRTVCIVDPANLASIRVATKLGYLEEAITAYLGDPTILFSRKKSY